MVVYLRVSRLIYFSIVLQEIRSEAKLWCMAGQAARDLNSVWQAIV
jgi:hypothetical protein